ncbi:syntaxin-1A-like [Euwallacea fornicatus]|uniref:syntaxin-1A-like n=1 Tax=Euwallacea fornicatus TaxID=995702 RepID=UPI00338DB2C9
MGKNRLDDLKKLRERNNDNTQVEIQEETRPLTGGSNLRNTFERAEVLSQWISTIEGNVEAIKLYVRKLDDVTVNQKDLNDKIDSLFQNNTNISHQIQSKIKEFEAEIQDCDTTSAEGRIKNIQYNTLKTRYQKIFKLNSTELENFRNIKKLQLEAQLRAKGVRVTDEELTRLLEDGTDIHVFTENILAETAEAKRVLQDIEDRHQQLLKIETMLVEVRDLFLQMAIIIDEQQELIDRVEYQAEMAQNFIGRGREDLKSGRKNRMKHLKLKIILIVIAIVFIIILIALIFK